MQPDLRRIVDEIRFYVQSTEAEMTETLRDAAQSYVEVCRQANARLRRCGEFLRKDLRSEAIQLAEADPDLLELVAAIDFPEREDWGQIAGIYDLPVPEPLLLDIAEALNEAYALQEPMSRLLQQHRRLAMSRAPLDQRLSVLRKLAQTDPSSSFWDTDVRTMERTRLQEIERASREAGRAGDAAALQALGSELASPQWRETVPPSLRKQVSQLSANSTAAAARRDMEKIAADLNVAFGAMDVAQARSLRSRWQELQGTAKVGNNDPLSDLAAPALAWLSDVDLNEAAERKAEKAIAALRKALDDGTKSRTELEQLGESVFRLQKNLPDSLEARYRNRVTAMQVQERRRLFLIVGSSIITATVVAGFVGFLLWRGVQHVESSRIADSVENMLQNGQIQQARQLVDQHANAYPSERWLSMLTTLGEAEGKEKNRLAEYRSLMQFVQETSSPSDALQRLKRAEEIAASGEEKADVSRLQAQWSAQLAKESAQRESTLNQKAEAVTSELGKLAQMLQAATRNDEEIQTAANRVASLLGELNGSLRPDDHRLLAQSKLLGTRLAAVKDDVLQSQEKRQLLETLHGGMPIKPADGDAVKKLFDYGEALKQFAKKFPKDSRSADFSAVAAEMPNWQGIVEWQRCCARWKELVPQELSEVRQRLDACRAYLKDYPNSPAAGVANRYEVLLASVLSRHEAEGEPSLKGKLLELFNGPLMRDTFQIQAKDGKSYYVSEEKNFTGEPSATFRYFTGFTAEDKRGKVLSLSDLLSLRTREAPQVVLSREIRNEVNAATIADWNARTRSICLHLHQNREIDPFLKYILLRYSLEIVASGDSLLAPELHKTRETLRNPEMDPSTKWMDPDDVRANELRRKAKLLLEEISGFESAWDRAAVAANGLTNDLRASYVFVGPIVRDASGRWDCPTKWTSAHPYDLFVMYSGDKKESPVLLQPFGEAKEGKLTLRSTSVPTGLMQGALLIASRKPSSPASGTGDQKAQEVGMEDSK